MALALYDRVQQTGTANTTVSFSLTGSVTGFQSFSVVGNGNTTYYSATDTSGNWEVGIGTYATGGTLTRTTILSSSNSGSAVTFSGTVSVFVTQPAENTVVSSNNPGTSGYVLTSNGTGVAPTWAASAGATITGTTSNSTYYVIGTTSTSGTLSTASISNTNVVSYNASTGALTAVTVTSSSDERLKQDIETITDALTKVETMRGVTYLRNGIREIGVVAQEVERVVPEVVHTEDGEYGYKSVSYGNMVGLLIEAVKELSAEVKALKAQIKEA
jgi:hypothetical protein